MSAQGIAKEARAGADSLPSRDFVLEATICAMFLPGNSTKCFSSGHHQADAKDDGETATMVKRELEHTVDHHAALAWERHYPCQHWTSYYECSG